MSRSYLPENLAQKAVQVEDSLRAICLVVVLYGSGKVPESVSLFEIPIRTAKHYF